MVEILSIHSFVLNGLLFITYVKAFNLKFDDILVAQQGLGWPQSLQVTKGHEALMKLTVAVEKQKSCVVATPAGVTFDINSPPSNRYQRWEDSCSIKVKNVELNDTGRWRLTATGENTTITGWTALHVREEAPTPPATPISLHDGETDVKVDLSSLENSYCLVAKPFSDSIMVPGHCTVSLDRTTRAVQGNWGILLGLPGRVSEVPLQRKVIVEEQGRRKNDKDYNNYYSDAENIAERLDVGYIHDTSTNKLHLHCNILHSEKNITFCRFQRTSKTYGYNVVDGLSDGSHSYYGKGFLWKECGITIEKPTQEDYGTWRCTLGLTMWVGNKIKDQPPMQALISVAPNERINSRLQRDASEHDNETVFVQEGGTLRLMCQAAVSLTYCWYQHPNGSEFTAVPLVSEDQPFWYTGEGLAAGQCGITFSHVTREDSGTWRCHMGPQRQLGLEVSNNLQVRVTGPLAANRKEVEATIGRSVILYCHTSNGNRPLEYCRFLSPSFVGINIDSSVTKENAILDRFYFTLGRNIDIGDCSLTISYVTEDDIGNWTCAGIVNDEAMESRDMIRVYISTRSVPRHQAGVIGASVGTSILVLVLIGYVVYKRSSILPLFHRNQNPPPSDSFSLQQMSASTSARSSQTSSELGTYPEQPQRTQ